MLQADILQCLQSELTKVVHVRRVPAGSTAKFSYTVSPLVAGFYSARPAKIIYRAFPDAPEKTVRSLLHTFLDSVCLSDHLCRMELLGILVVRILLETMRHHSQLTMQAATSSTPHFHILSTLQKFVQAGLTAVRHTFHILVL